MERDKFPLCVLLFSGKRKSGKDFFTEKLLESLDNKSKDAFAVIKISAPIKTHFAEKSNLNLSELMGSGEYKERFRKEMIEWSDNVRQNEPGAFCRAAIDMCKARTKAIWIVSDVRRNTDINWFRENFGEAVKTVRITADDQVRMARGWSFVPGIDDVASECDLDEYKNWDWKFSNNDDGDVLNASVKQIRDYLLPLLDNSN